MKLSTRGRYGLRACFALACTEDKLNLNELAKRTGVSAKYLERLLAMLKSGGLVCGSRGANGGYNLSRAAADISLGEILRSLNELDIIDCIDCSKDDYCPNRKIFSKLQQNVNQLFDNYSLAELVDENSCKGTI